MALDIHFEVTECNIETEKIMDAVRHGKLGKFAATEWMRLYRRYMPYEPRAFTIEPWMIIHQEPYAHYHYEGNVRGPNIPIRNGESFFSPIAPKYLTGKRLHFAHGSDHWDEKATTTQAPKLMRALQAFIDKEGIL